MTTTVVASHCFSVLATAGVAFVIWHHWNTLFCCFTADPAERRIFTMVGAAALACLVVAEVADRRRIAYYATRCILAATSSVALILPFASDTFEHGALHTYTLYVGLGFALALFSIKLAWYRGPSTIMLFLGSVASLAAYRLLFLSQYMSVDDKGTDRSCDHDTPFRWVENTLYATLVFLFAFTFTAVHYRTIIISIGAVTLWTTAFTVVALTCVLQEAFPTCPTNPTDPTSTGGCLRFDFDSLRDEL